MKTATESVAPTPGLQPLIEEIANSLTHGLGLLMSVVGAAVLMPLAAIYQDTRIAVGCGIYCLTLVAVYLASTLSHAVFARRARHLFRMLDQGFIYLLIAGTYTPMAMAYFNTGHWWILTAAMWSIALGGFLSKTLLAHRVNRVSMWLYLTMGWLPLLGAGHLWRTMPPGAIVLALSGGACFTVGAVFLVMDTRVRFFHAAWHLWVIAGCACHYALILFYIAL